MKKQIYLVLGGMFGLLVALSGCSQKVVVPDKVTTAFKTQFTGAAKVKWSKESDKEFEAEFHLAGIEMSANFTEDGQWVETETEIPKKDLPAAVTDTLNAKYPGFRIEEAAWTETAGGGSFYELNIEKKREELILHIDRQGQVLKSVTEENEEGGRDEDND